MHEQTQRTKIVVLYCQHCVTRGVESRSATQEHDGVVVQTEMMPCSSKVQASELLKLLAAGADGVEIVACADAACRLLVGSRMAEKRLRYVQRLLEEAHVRGERLGFSLKSGVAPEELLAMGLRRASAVEASRGGQEA
jgi:F420-non-reducing hydrogenase iron-sulfur subunit